MWVYVVIFFLVKDVPIECPNGLVDCQVYHYRRDTTMVNKLRYCEREPALREFNFRQKQGYSTFYGSSIHWNAVKFDSTFQEIKKENLGEQSIRQK